MPGQEAIAEIFLSWRDHLARVVSRIVPPHEIEDIVQETYVRACQCRSREEIQSPGAYMTQIARNLAIDHIKRAQSRLSTELDEETEVELGELRRLVDEPYHQVASNEEFALFCEAVRELPQQCRRVFVMRKVYGHTQREIAAALDLSESTVEKHIGQGIKRCTQFMRRHTSTESIPELQRPASREGGSR